LEFGNVALELAILVRWNRNQDVVGPEFFDNFEIAELKDRGAGHTNFLSGALDVTDAPAGDEFIALNPYGRPRSEAPCAQDDDSYFRLVSCEFPQQKAKQRTH
jgi:hypothetical protein